MARSRMRRETRIELIVLILAGLAGASWLGLRMTGRQEPASPPAARAHGAQHRRTTSAPPKPRSLQIDIQPQRARPAATAAKTAPAEQAESPPPAPQPRPAAGGEQTPAEAAAKPTPPRSADLAKAKDLLEQGNLFEARAILTRLILSAQEGPDREQLKDMLDGINRRLFFSKAPAPDCVFYTVQDGDTLSGIAKKHGKDIYFSHLIMQLNGIHDPRRIRPGQRLKIPQGEFSALVQTGAHRLIILLNGHYIMEYQVGLCMPQTPTPLGTFRVGVKKVEPDWYTPDGHVYRFGDPRNILGTRWIGFEDTQEFQGYGIHGTNDPTGLGKDVSNGCIRMLNEEVEEVFGMLMPGDVVRITP